MSKYLFLAVILSLFSCDNNRVFEQNQSIKEDFWYVDSLVSFQFEIKDAQEPYNLYANFSHSSAYNYYNLYYRFTLEDSAGKDLESKLVNIHLFDPKSGTPLGDGLGDIFDHQQLVKEKFQFERAGKYQVSFQQYMRTDSLPEIKAVGLRVEKALSPGSGE